MQKNSRNNHRFTRTASDETDEPANSQSYFEWREQTVRMPAAVAHVPRPESSSPIVRIIRRIAGKH